MRCCFLVNDPDGLEATQTTWALIQRAVERGHAVYVAGVADLSYTPDERVVAHARRIPRATPPSTKTVAALPVAPTTLDEMDVLLIRTNPGRDLERRWAHQTALAFARMLRERGVLVLNDPDGLLRASTKFYLQSLPLTVRPRTLVSRDRAAIIAFIEALNGPAVLKPLLGSRGTDVFMVRSATDTNLPQIIDVLLRQGFPIVQEFVPEAVEGDTRVVVMDGALLAVDGRVAAVRRVPEEGDFRSNVHTGGRVAPATPTAAMRAVVAAVGPRLARDRIFLAGLDLIGDKLVEINAFSTGGLPDAERFEGVDFTGAVLDTVERRLVEAG